MYVQAKDRARAIGKNQATLNRSKTILKRHYNIDNVFINVETPKPSDKPQATQS